MFVYGYIYEINKLKFDFKKIKEAVENEDVPCYFAKSRVNTLLKKEKRLKVVFQEMDAENEVINEINSLIYETNQFLKDIVNIIDIERKTCL